MKWKPCLTYVAILWRVLKNYVGIYQSNRDEDSHTVDKLLSFELPTQTRILQFCCKHNKAWMLIGLLNAHLKSFQFSNFFIRHENYQFSPKIELILHQSIFCIILKALNRLLETQSGAIKQKSVDDVFSNPNETKFRHRI